MESGLNLGYTVRDRWVWMQMSDVIDILPEKKSHIEFNTLDEAKSCFLRQKVFTDIQGCLKVLFLMRDKSRMVFEDFDHTLDDWFSDRATKLAINGNGWDQDQAKRERWFSHIRVDFIRFFGAITRILRDIHSSGNYHGNVRDGIAIKNESAFLYNMKEKTGGLRDLQLQDYNELIRIIDNVLDYPCYVMTPKAVRDTLWGYGSVGVKAKIKEVEELCLVQLRGVLNNSLEPRWATHPALFWGVHEQLDFLSAIHYVIYQHGNHNSFKRYIDPYFKKGWHVPIQSPNGSASLRSVLAFHVQQQKSFPYGDGMSQMLFWRNAKEHVKLQLNPHTRRSSAEIIHGLVLQEVDECLHGSLLAMNKLAQSSNRFLFQNAQLICNEMKLEESRRSLTKGCNRG